MHIFLWGFLVLALIELNMAASSDKVKNDGRENEADKSQLDMILAQLQRQEDRLQRQEDEQQQQIHEQKKEQQLMNEVLQDQIQEQKHKNDDQEREMKEQRRKNDKQERETKEQRHNINKLQEEIKELTKVNRARRSGNETEHLLELIRAEINHVAGLSQCEVGVSSANKPSGKKDATVTQTISFKQKFKRTPEVVTSVSAFYRYKDGSFDGSWGPYVSPQSITTTKFDLLHKFWGNTIYYSRASWIACI